MTVETNQVESSRLDRPESAKNASVEDLEDAFNEVRELGHRWEDRFTFENPHFAERYFKGECMLVLECRFTDGFPEDFRAILQRELSVRGADGEGREDEGFVLPRDVHLQGYGDTSIGGPYRHEKMVLVLDGELVKPPEGFTTSLVWLERDDEPFRTVGGSLYASQTFGTKLLGGLADRKRGLVVGGSPSFFDQLPRQQIERRTEVMEDVAENDPPFLRRIGVHADLENHLSCFGVVLTEKGIGVTVQKRADFPVKLTDVLFGPINL